MRTDPDPEGTEKESKMRLDPDLEPKPITSLMIEAIWDFNNNAELHHFREFLTEGDAAKAYGHFISQSGRNFTYLYNHPDMKSHQRELNNMINRWQIELHHFKQDLEQQMARE